MPGFFASKFSYFYRIKPFFSNKLLVFVSLRLSVSILRAGVSSKPTSDCGSTNRFSGKTLINGHNTLRNGHNTLRNGERSFRSDLTQ